VTRPLLEDPTQSITSTFLAYFEHKETFSVEKSTEQIMEAAVLQYGILSLWIDKENHPSELLGIDEGRGLDFTYLEPGEIVSEEEEPLLPLRKRNPLPAPCDQDTTPNERTALISSPKVRTRTRWCNIF